MHNRMKSSTNAGMRSFGMKSLSLSLMAVVSGCLGSEGVFQVSGNTDTLQVTLDTGQVAVGQISTSVSELEIDVGSSVQLSATALNTLGFDVNDVPIQWSSSDNGVAFAGPSGLITGISAGSVDVFASGGGVSATIPTSVFDTVVTPPPPPPPPPPGPLPSGGTADQTIDWGSFASVNDIVADPNIEGISWAPNIELVSDVPSGSDFTGSYRVAMTSSNFLPGGFNIYIPNADALRVREIYERWYLKFEPGFTFTWPGCSSAGMKINLWGSNPDFQRTDFIMNEFEFTMTMANAFGDQDWEGFEQQISPSPDLFDGQWHRFELHLRMGSGFLANDAAYELWIDGVPAHELNAANRPAWDSFETTAGYGLEDYFVLATWTDTYNCEEELGMTSGQSIAFSVSGVERWWTSVPAWYEALPASQKYPN